VRPALTPRHLSGVNETGRKQVVIVGGGFGGVYAALELERRLGTT
jgi:cation diffusion facilitator CzcD-associated flavoprotein CzcO